MANPITWQNVNGPNLAEALRPLQAAQGSFNGAFAGLGDILKERTAIEAANAVQVNKNNVQSYLDEVARQGATPEQLQASIQSGQLEKLRASFGGGADFKAATRGAAESLLADRYKQVQAATEFGNTMLNEKTAPIMDRFKQATLREDEVGKEKARAEYTAAGGKHGADLDSFAQNVSRDNLKWDETKKGWVRDQGKYDSDLRTADATIENQKGMLSVARQNAATNAAELKLRTEDMGFKRADRTEDRISKINASLGALGSRSATTDQGITAISQAITQNIKDPNSHNNANRAVAEMIKAVPGLTTGAAIAGVLGAGNTNWHTFDSTIRERALEIAKTAMASSSAAASRERASAQEAVLYEQLNRAQESAARIDPITGAVVSTPKESTGGVTTIPVNPFDPDTSKLGTLSAPPTAAPTVASVPAPKSLVARLDAAAAAANPAKVREIETMSSAGIRELRTKFQKEMKELSRGDIKELSPDAAAFRAYTDPPDSLTKAVNRNRVISGAAKSTLDWLLAP